MKLFKLKELKELVEKKERKIKFLKQELREEENLNEIKDKNIVELEEALESKDRQIDKLWKEKTEVILEKNQYFKTVTQAADKNIKLKKEIERLRSGIKAGIIPEPFVANVKFISYKEHEGNVDELAEAIHSNLTRINGQKPYKEHVCTIRCFGKHVIKAIQKDYDSINPKYKKDKQASADFLQHWYSRLRGEYEWLDYLYMVDGKVYFKSIF